MHLHKDSTDYVGSLKFSHRWSGVPVCMFEVKEDLIQWRCYDYPGLKQTYVVENVAAHKEIPAAPGWLVPICLVGVVFCSSLLGIKAWLDLARETRG